MYFKAIYFFLNIFLCFQSRLVAGIIGGFSALPGQIPYQVSLRTNKIHICGGAIVNPQYVITAAHCVMDTNGKFLNFEFTILSGVIDIQENKKKESEVEEIYIPADFKLNNNIEKNSLDFAQADIAVLKLKKPLYINENKAVSEVQLPEQSNILILEDKDISTVSGFGLNDIAEQKGSSVICRNCMKLKYAETRIIPNSWCQLMYSTNIIQVGHICAQVKQYHSNKPEGVCDGDDGGPLIHNGRLVGILSATSPNCDETYKASIYSNVTYYLPFIQKALNGETSSDIRFGKYIDVKQTPLKKNTKVLMETSFDIK